MKKMMMVMATIIMMGIIGFGIMKVVEHEFNVSMKKTACELVQGSLNEDVCDHDGWSVEYLRGYGKVVILHDYHDWTGHEMCKQLYYGDDIWDLQAMLNDIDCFE